MALRRTVAVGMSGGVDSSVTALLVTEMGLDAVGVTMTIYESWRASDLPGQGAEPRPMGGCYGPDEGQDVEDAAAVCRALGIPHRVVDLRAEYRTHVLDYFREEYLAGRTPNPCVRCNQYVKFGMLVRKLSAEAGHDFDLFATGHYARVSQDASAGRMLLSRAADAGKDQTYFLCMLSQEQLGRALFPLGEMTKAEVRRIARQRGLAVCAKPDSQNFAGGDYREILDPGMAAGGSPDPRTMSGEIRDSRGEVLGTHKGIWAYTIGQRRGLGIAAGEPLYVTSLDRASNTVVVGPEKELYRSGLTTGHLNWVSIPAPAAPIRAGVRIRYQGREAPALVTPAPDGSASIRFDEPQKAVAAGQWAVLYNGPLLLAGGVIEASW
jgi:tRNA-uridine 2-sulfurtransferase